MATTIIPTPASPVSSPAPTTSAAPVAPTPAPATEAPKNYADAKKAFAGQTSWENVQFPGMAATAGDPENEAPTPETPAAPTPEAPAPEGDGPEFVQDAQGKWHRADGTMASADEIAQISAQLAAETPAEALAVEEPPKTFTAKLRGRDGQMVEVEVPDEQTAQLINQNTNDGMRAKEFREKSAALDAQLAKFKRLDAMIDSNPESVVFESLNPQQRVNLATMLLAQHFDDLVPIIQQYDQNPATRIAATGLAAERMRRQTTEFQSITAAQEAAANARMAVASLIPDTAPEADQEAFWIDASRDVQDALNRGETVNASTIPTILAGRMARYGFTATPAQPPARPRITLAGGSAGSSAGSANPSPAAASSIASPATEAAKLADVKAQQTRLRLRQTQRAHAAAVPPVGAGAAPVRMPPIAPGSTVEEASKTFRKQTSWGAPPT